MATTRDEIQEKIELTPKQLKAFTSLKRAFARCKKENIYFYQMLHVLSGLNGDNVADIMTDVEYPGAELFDPLCLQYLDYPSINVTCSFADDNHFVKIRR